jgi:hypothetical protein
MVEDADQIGGHAGRDLHRLGARAHAAEEERREDDADSARSTEEGDGDGVEPDGRVVRGGHHVGDAEQLGGAGQAGQQSGARHGQDDDPPR